MFNRKNRPGKRTFQVERLEDRHMMTVVTVTPPFDGLPQTLDRAPSEVAPSDISIVQELPLHSLPNAPTKLFLDFNGHYQQERFGDWGPFGGWDNILTPAFDRDGDPNHFSPEEQDDIRFIWASVAEDYAPFNIDVTTVDPDPGGYHPELPYMRIVISGAGDFTGNGLSGVSDKDFWGNYGSYADSGEPNVSYVFNLKSNNSHESVEFLAVAAAHEAGHAFGLAHYSDSLATGLRAPIMAVTGHPTAERQTWFQISQLYFGIYILGSSRLTAIIGILPRF